MSEANYLCIIKVHSWTVTSPVIPRWWQLYVIWSRAVSTVGQTHLYHGGWNTFHNTFFLMINPGGRTPTSSATLEMFYLTDLCHLSKIPAGSSCKNRFDQCPHNQTREEPTFLLLPQVFHNNEGQDSSSHQSCQDPQNNPHHVVVTHSHHCAHVVDLPVDGDLENRQHITVSQVFFSNGPLTWLRLAVFSVTHQSSNVLSVGFLCSCTVCREWSLANPGDYTSSTCTQSVIHHVLLQSDSPSLAAPHWGWSCF